MCIRIEKKKQMYIVNLNNISHIYSIRDIYYTNNQLNMFKYQVNLIFELHSLTERGRILHNFIDIVVHRSVNI